MIPTALATFVLAVITLVSVIVGGLALRKAQNEIDPSRREVEEAHRPVLIPVIDETQSLSEYDANTASLLRPYYKDAARVVIPIKNIWSGPALSITAAITPRNDAGDFSEVWGDNKHSATVVGLGVSEVYAVAVYADRLGDLPNFDLWLTYEDVAGKTWQTSAKFLKQSSEFTALSIVAGP